MASFADQLFESERAYKIVDDELWRRVCAAIGFDYDKQEDLEKVPFNRITYDDYDTSIELKGANTGFDLMPEQLEKIWELGFDRMWICPKEGKEKYYQNGA